MCGYVAGHRHLSAHPSCPPSLRDSPLRPNASLPESEAGAEAREVAAVALPRRGLTQAEEGVTLDGALPQVLAALGAGQLEQERVLLLPTLDPPGRTKHSQAPRARGVGVCCYFRAGGGEAERT